MNLSYNQIEAVTTSDSRVLVAAGPGAGKTAVLTERIRYLIEKGANAGKIYAITFTRNAAAEMKERLGSLSPYLFVGTIHALAVHILQSNGVPVVIENEDEDFDKLFGMVKDLKNPILPEIDHILVDEFQDTTDSDCEFIFDTLKPKAYFIVGDSAQSIYSFRGGNYKNFMNLAEDSLTQVYTLNDDYRNAQGILSYAKGKLKGVRNIYRIPLICTREDEGEVIEMPFSFETLIEEIKGRDMYKDWFVLARTNREVNDIISIFTRNNIPSLTFKQAEQNYEELKKKLETDTVKVLTIHSAKGLEAKNVAVIGARNYNDEEKRLAYVAATRAKDLLIFFTSDALPRKKKTAFKYEPTLKHW